MRLGEVEAFVDTGAGISIVNAELIRTRPSFIAMKSTKSLWDIGGAQIPSNGEVKMMIKYKGHVVGLNVVVVPGSACPLLLGRDWIEAAKAAITWNGRSYVVEVDKAVVSPTPEIVNSGPERSSEPEESGHESLRQDVNLADDMPDIPREGVTRPQEADQPVIEPPDPSESPVTEPSSEQEDQNGWISGLNHISDTVDMIRTPKRRCRPAAVKKIPPESCVLVRVNVPSSGSGLWFIQASGGAREDHEWYTPNCVVSANDGEILVPVMNLGKNALRSRKTKFKWTVNEVDRDSVWPVDEQEIEPPEELVPPGTEVEETGWQEVPLGDHLTTEEKGRLEVVLTKHARCFSSTRGHTTLLEHRIDTGDAAPVHSAPHRVSAAEKRIIREQVEGMLNDGVIEPSVSPWSSPVVLVKKKDGSVRFCVDYRRLNAISRHDVYPLPLLEDVVGHLAGAEWFSSLDLASSYHQVSVAKDDRSKTAFITPDGLYQFRRVPFGLHGAAPLFQRLMDRVLTGLKWTHCLVYMDDVLIFGRDFDEHLHRLDRVLNALENAGLTLNRRKCLIAVKEVRFLGYVVNAEGIRPNPDKLEAIQQFPRPENATQLRGFVGLASFYRKFVPGFAGIAAPLHSLLKKGADVRLDWTDRQEEAFEELKRLLTIAPVLAHDDGVSPLELHVDASGHGLGAVLLIWWQEAWHPVIYVSRALTSAESSYHANEKEALGLVWALSKLRCFLYGRRFVAKTDSNVLKWLQTKKDVSGKFARWILAMQEFDFELKHQKGTANIPADALSRAPNGQPEMTDPTEVFLVIRKDLSSSGSVYTAAEISLLQLGDEGLREIINQLRKAPTETSGTIEGSDYALQDDVLYKRNTSIGRKWLVVVPSIMRRDVITACHDGPSGGHQGEARTIHKVAQRYFWPGMNQNIKAYVRSCLSCQINKSQTGLTPRPFMPISPPERPFQMVGVDHVGPLTLTQRGNKFMIVVVDYLTKWIIAEPVPDTSTEIAAKMLKDRVISVHGAVERIVTDRGSCFTSESFRACMQELGIRHVMATTERPHTNGLVERTNGSLITALRCVLNQCQGDWDVQLPWAVFSLNTAKHEQTQFTPFELVFGRVAVLPPDTSFPWPAEKIEDYTQHNQKVDQWRRVARQRILQHQAKRADAINGRRGKMTEFRPGELVLVSRTIRKPGRTQKFLPRFIGPFQIVYKICPTTYMVEELPALRRRRRWRRFPAHCAQIRPYRIRNEVGWKPEEWKRSVETTRRTGVDQQEHPASEDSNLPLQDRTDNGKERQEMVSFPANESVVTRSGRMSRKPKRYGS